MKIEDTTSRKLVQTYEKSGVIFSQDSPGNEMYIVYSGKVQLFSQVPSGQSRLLATLETGDFFGEMALVDDSPRSATAIAGEENTQLLVLDKSKFTYLIRNQPEFALVVMGKLCQHLREANKAI